MSSWERTRKTSADYAAARKEREQAKFERGECRACTEPCAVVNGRRLRMCLGHLKTDRARKPVKKRRLPL